MRAGYLLEKLKAAQTKVNTLEKENEATKVRDLVRGFKVRRVHADLVFSLIGDGRRC